MPSSSERPESLSLPRERSLGPALGWCCTALGLALVGCQALSGLSDYEVGPGSGGGPASTGTSTASTGSAGGDGQGGAGGAACVPAEEVCGNGEDEDCDAIDCSATLWATALGGAAFQVPYAVAVLPSGAIAIAGTYGDGAMVLGDDVLPPAVLDGFGLFYALLEPDGTPIWSLGIADGAGSLPALAADGDGVVIAGRFQSEVDLGGHVLSSTGRDPFVARVTDRGDVEWAVALDGAGTAIVNDLAVRGGEVLAGGAFTTAMSIAPMVELAASGGDGQGGGGTGVGDIDGFVAVLDGGSGDGLRATAIGFSEPSTQGVSGAGYVMGGDLAIVAPFSGGVTLAEPHDGSAGFAVARLGEDLAPSWQRVVQATDLFASSMAVHDAAIDGDRIVVTGRVAGTWEHVDSASDAVTPLFQTTGPDDVDLFVAVWSASGELLWTKQLGDTNDQTWLFQYTGVALADDGGVTLAAGLRGIIDAGGDALASADGAWLVASWDGGGEHRWSRRYEAVGSADGATSVEVDASTGDLIVAGTTGAPLDVTDPPVEPLDEDATTVVVARFAN